MTTSDLVRNPPDGVPEAKLDLTSRDQLLDLATRGNADGNYEAARDVLQGLVVLNRQDARAWALLGQVEHNLKHLTDACDALARALSLQRKDWDVALELAEVHHELHAENEAQALLTYVALEAPGLTKEQLKRIKAIGGRS